jgi:hypothetical protein
MQTVADLIEQIIHVLTEAVRPEGRAVAGQDQETPSQVEQPRKTSPPKEAGQEDQAEPAPVSRLWTELLLGTRPEPNPISIQRQARLIANTIPRPAIPLPPAPLDG